MPTTRVQIGGIITGDEAVVDGATAAGKAS